VKAVLSRTAWLGLASLRIQAIRWLLAGMIPFGCLAAGFMIARAWRPLGIAGFGLASLGNWALCIVYFHKMLGAARQWVVVLLPLIIGNAWAGAVTIVGSVTVRTPVHPGGVTITATSSWWIAQACLTAALAAAAAAAVLNGERWLRRTFVNLPRGKFDAHASPRGGLSACGCRPQP
jgi:hypothetical protein